jgi:hypothetical protein
MFCNKSTEPQKGPVFIYLSKETVLYRYKRFLGSSKYSKIGCSVPVRKRFDSRLTVPGGNIPEIKTDQVKVTRSLGRIAHFRLPSGIIGMPATWVDCSSSRYDAAKL